MSSSDRTVRRQNEFLGSAMLHHGCFYESLDEKVSYTRIVSADSLATCEDFTFNSSAMVGLEWVVLLHCCGKRNCQLRVMTLDSWEVGLSSERRARDLGALKIIYILVFNLIATSLIIITFKNYSYWSIDPGSQYYPPDCNTVVQLRGSYSSRLYVKLI